ncbi:DUF2790 domain-containing protein [Pseudomonas sp. UBA7233]|nr:DUF2790 domain-containing protein [Pseudomonas sp. UBA7233]
MRFNDLIETNHPIEEVIIMKYAIATALLASAFATGAFAADSRSAQDNIPVEQYHYGMKIDVAKVISIEKADTNDLNNAEPATMVYQDHQGNVHKLQYLESVERQNTNG